MKPVRTILLVLPLLILTLLSVSIYAANEAEPSSPEALIVSQDSAEDSDENAKAKEAEAEKLPMPNVAFAVAADSEAYVKAVSMLESKEYKAARVIFTKLKSKATEDTQKEAVQRGISEAKGGMEFEKVLKLVEKRKNRKAIGKLNKLTPKYDETQIGIEMKNLLEELMEDLFWTVANFEKASSSAKGEDEEEEDDGGNAGGGNRGLGTSGYGLNSKVIDAERDKTRVREGDHSLRWQTGKNLSELRFENVDEKVADYRYLNFSIRSESNKIRPQIVILLDCREGNIDLNGVGGRRGVRGMARLVFSREGYTYSVTPKKNWQDLRIDLKKFVRKTEVNFEDIKKMRFIHMPGASGTVYIDNIRFEKE